MRVPQSVLPHQVTVAEFLGQTGANGPTYGRARRCRALVEPARKQTAGPAQKTVRGDATIVVSGNVTVDAEAEVVVVRGPVRWIGKRFRVLTVTDADAPGGTVSRVLTVQGPR